MADRAYTVTELDALRRVIRRKATWGRYDGDLPMPKDAVTFVQRAHTYAPDVLNRIVEEQARTHMIAGHTAEDLLASDPPLEESVYAGHRQFEQHVMDDRARRHDHGG